MVLGFKSLDIFLLVHVYPNKLCLYIVEKTQFTLKIIRKNHYEKYMTT